MRPPDDAAEAAQLFGHHAGRSADAGADFQREWPGRAGFVPDFNGARVGADAGGPACAKNFHPVEAPRRQKGRVRA